MMTKEELAKSLDGCAYLHETDNVDMQAIKEAGLVIVFGQSDDLMEFEGAICDEISCYDGGTAYILPDGLLTNGCENPDCPYFKVLQDKAQTIEALWCDNQDICWIYQTEIPHETFNVMDYGEIFCRGIVFDMADVK